MSDTKQLDTVNRLMTKFLELQAQQFELIKEVQALCGGGLGVGEHMKRLEASFAELWSARYARGTTERYVWAFARDRALMKRLLKYLTPGEIEGRMHAFFKSDDGFYRKTRHNFPTFAATVNSLVDLGEDQPVTSRVVGCKHAPACTSDQMHTRLVHQDLTKDTPF